ncbi:MAG: molecular chaperone DnaK [Deltaproteobacteria bacterium]|nr:molecular chaperone DnaK [Deltaproteobacteria bacterium]
MAQEVAMGIDLGTSNSSVSIIQDGQAVVIPNEWGELTHASVVSFLEDGSVLVGNDAKKQMCISPETTISSAKRLIGRYFFSEEVKKARAVMPYAIVEGPNSGVRIAVRDQIYAVPEISAMVLKEMKAITEAYVGHPVTKAVVTVPAFFNDNQRQATKDAGRIAGLDVLRILNEPTAAALAYGFGNNVNQRVVIYDLGGGTFDVSILEIGTDVFEVLGTAGDTYLGGDDFDDRVLQWLLAGFKQQYGVDLMQDRYALQKVKEAAEKAKNTFSDGDTAQIHVPLVHTDAEGMSYDLEATLTRQQFNHMVMDLVQRTFKVCDEALQSGRMTANDIDGVILVGGPTRLPVIRNSVRHYFQREPNTSINPDLVVCMGAAIQAHALLNERTSSFLLDVTPMTLRLGTVGGYTEAIIDKNTPIPIDRSRTFTTVRDGQEKVNIRIYQGESRMAQECTMLGEFEFSGLRPARRGDVKVEVTFEIDTDGIVRVTARDGETGQVASTNINLSSGLSESEIQNAASRNAATALAPHEKQDGEVQPA